VGRLRGRQPPSGVPASLSLVYSAAMRLFHGTKRQIAATLAGVPPGGGTISVTRGAGEFGKGFYTGESEALAHAWAQNRFRADPGVLQLDVSDSVYKSLKRKDLDEKRACALTRELRSRKATGTYVSGHDVLAGPIENRPRYTQQKFESLGSASVLNGNGTVRTVK
jgi:hypothetical protein